LSTGAPAPQRLDEALGPTHGVHFDGARLLEARRSTHQTIEVFETPDLGRLMRIDGCNMVSERDEFLYHEALVHPAALAHPAPRRALIVGGGDGGAAEELLKHPSLTRVTVAELDDQVVALARKHLGAVHGGALDDARVSVRIGDAGALLAQVTESADLIFFDLTDPVGPAAALYSEAAYRRCARLLGGDGALVVHLGSPFSHPARVRSTCADLRRVFAQVTPYFVHIPMYGALWGFAHATQAPGCAALPADLLAERLAGRGIAGLRWAAPATMLAAAALPAWVRAVIG
jgi:spermidine synthase